MKASPDPTIKLAWLKALAAFAWLTSPLALSAAEPGDRIPCDTHAKQGDRALVIGIGGYQQGDNLRLNGPSQDRENIRKLLVDVLGYGFEQVCVLADAQATAASIRHAFQRWLVDGTRPGDRAFFYFSGHGVRLDGGGVDLLDERFDDALAAHDYEPKSNRGTIRDDDLGQWFAQLSGRSVTAVVDSCHSGTIYRSGGQPLAGELARTPRLRATASPFPGRSRSSAPANPIIAPRPGLVVWTAAADFEVAFDAPVDEPSYGQFTEAWIRAIRREPNATVSNVLASVRRDARAYCEQLMRAKSACTSLTPQLHAADPVLKEPILASLQARVTDSNVSWHRDIAAVLDATQQVSVGPQSCGSARMVRDIAPRPAGEASSGSANACIELALVDAYGSPSNVFQPDSPVTLDVRSQIPGYLTVFALDREDHLRRIFPEDPDKPKESAIAVGQVDSIPGFTIHGPAGEYQLVALVSERPLDIRSSLTRGGASWGTQPPRKPEQAPTADDGPLTAAESIGGLVSQLLAGEGSNGGDVGDWAYAVIEYRVKALEGP